MSPVNLQDLLRNPEDESEKQFFFFDIGWTLVYSQANDYGGKGPAKTIAALLEARGYMIAESGHQTALNRHALRAMTIEENHAAWGDWRDRLIDWGVTAEHATDIAQHVWKQQYMAPHAMPHADALLDSLLKQRQHEAYAFGVISNISPPYFAGACARIPALANPKVIKVLSYKQECAKPDLELYKIARRAAESITLPLVMVGDSVKNDIEPAAQLGFSTVHLPYN